MTGCNEAGKARKDIPLSFPDVRSADADAVLAVLRSGWLTSGAECAAFEEELRTYLGADHVVAMSSCTAALEVAIASLNLAPGAKIGVPTWTFVSTALAAVKQGAVPVLLDIEAPTLNVSAESLAAAIKSGLDGVVVVHFGGAPVALEIHEMCGSARIPVVEDAAHALGASDHRGRVGSEAAVGACFSFYASKNLTCGEGGALATNDAVTAKFARTHRLHGLSTDTWSRHRHEDSDVYDLLRPGIKANLPDILAAMARSQLGRFDEMQLRRREIVIRYRSLLAGEDRVAFVPPELDVRGADHLMAIVLDDEVDRSTIATSLAADGIGTSVHFRPLHRFQWFAQNAIVGPSGTPSADRLAGRVLSLPLYSGMSDSDVDWVCESLRAALDR